MKGEKQVKKWIVFIGSVVGLAIFFMYSHQMGGDSQSHVSSQRSLQSVDKPENTAEDLDKKLEDQTFEEAFLEKYPSDWIFQKTAQGEVARILGGSIKGIGNHPDQVISLARDLAIFSRVVDSSFEYRSKKVTATTTHFVVQFFNDFEVYNGWIQVTSSNKEGKKGDVYLIEVSIKDVEEDVPTEILFTLEQAKGVVEKEFPEGVEVEIGVISDTPKIWAEQPGHELAWELSALLRKPRLEDYEIVVGAHTGQVRSKLKVSKN